jgi:hypothetical protein
VPCLHQGVLSGCVLAELGVLRMGRDEGEDSGSALLGAGLRGGLEIPLGDRLLVQMHADLIGVVAPALLRIDGGEAWRSPTLSAFFGAGLAFSFE